MLARVAPRISERRGTLRRCYQAGRVPFFYPTSYSAEWGAPMTEVRLRKIAVSLAVFARNAQRNGIGGDRAIEHWCADLQWLRTEFYEGRYRFAWPGSSVW